MLAKSGQGVLHDPVKAEQYRIARLSRDARFDGLFFVGVFSTGIYCRPICPAVPAKEANVRYFADAISAAQAGLRPCLRCRPDSAPGSNPWLGTQTSLNRALNLINAGVLAGPQAISMSALAERLGIGERYLRQLFQQSLGTSPKQYALYHQLMFAKQLLHQTQMPITQVAFAAGFNSVRRFNEIFREQLQLTPSEIRKTGAKAPSAKQGLTLKLAYRPPYDWTHLRDFYTQRMVPEMEWIDEQSYGRSFTLNGVRGHFTAKHSEEEACFYVDIHLARAEDLRELKGIVSHIRRLLDLDADPLTIGDRLSGLGAALPKVQAGMRIPGVWSPFEAACRAILGQQVSVTQAVKLLGQLVADYGETVTLGERTLRLFPQPEQLTGASMEGLKMPGVRKEAIRALATFVAKAPEADIESWLQIKGIGPWTLDYVRLRGLSLPDVLLSSDLVVKQQLLLNLPGSWPRQACEDPKAVKKQAQKYYQELSHQLAQEVAPWGSYLTLQLWNQQ
ncbi:DNA-3-methyladenine glycosylase 2 family protein [Shewanella sp.]|uniref:DNA-3-methyladenine glycosylase 2 family protein n=1 Tax=Shewanella sp. TaxID=50422 RepID=UPI003D12FAFD